MPRSLLLLFLAAGLAAAGYFAYRAFQPPKPPPAPVTVAAARPREKAEVPDVRFADVTASSGVDFVHNTGAYGAKLLPETMGGGVAVLDYNGDGRPDLYFPQSGPWPGEKATSTGKLFRNEGNWKFTDATAEAGLAAPIYGMGACAGDVDNDGRVDLFVSCVGRHRLFRNVDGRRFEPLDLPGGTDLPAVGRDEWTNWKPPVPFGSSCTFLDFDADGRLDLFVCHYVTWSPAVDRSVASTLEGLSRAYVQPREFEGAQCALYRNVDGKAFEDVSAAAGVRVVEKEGSGPGARERGVAKALGVVACDPDGDGYPDLLVANDTVRNFFFRNKPGPNGGRVFAEEGHRAGAAYADEGRPRGGMGVDWAEFAPGRRAAVVANFANEPVTLLGLERPEPPLFADCALTAGLAGPSRAALKFGACFFDYDLDGRQDLLVCDGHIEPEISKVQASQTHAQPAMLFWNTGLADCRFEPATPARAGADLFRPMVGRGCAYADFDGDGDLDVVLVANGGPARLLRNDAPPKTWLRLRLEGDGKAVNRSGIGAAVEVTAGGATTRWYMAGGRGYLSQPEAEITVGLGSADAAERVAVRWPGPGATAETWGGLAAGKTHALTAGGGKR